MKRDQISVNDRQLACARVTSQEGQDYLKGMAAAGNYAWVNRSSMTFLTRQVRGWGSGWGWGRTGGGLHSPSSFQAFSKVFATTPDDLDMHVIYDVSHNIAKVEEHVVDGRQRTLLVHRKGSTRAFPPHHPLIPVDYQVRRARAHAHAPALTDAVSPPADGTARPDRGDHGHLQLRPDGDRTGHDGDVWNHVSRSGRTLLLGNADPNLGLLLILLVLGAFQGRALSRAKSRRNLDFQDVLDKLADLGIAIRVASPKLVMEEVSGRACVHTGADVHVDSGERLFPFQAPESYKNVTDVVNTCHEAGISRKAIKLRPIAVIKG